MYREAFLHTKTGQLLINHILKVPSPPPFVWRKWFQLNDFKHIWICTSSMYPALERPPHHCQTQPQPVSCSNARCPFYSSHSGASFSCPWCVPVNLGDRGSLEKNPAAVVWVECRSGIQFKHEKFHSSASLWCCMMPSNRMFLFDGLFASCNSVSVL